MAAFQRGEHGEAIQAWKAARRAGAGAALDRALAEAHFRRALTANGEGRRAQELQEAVTLAPERHVYHFHLGLSFHRQGQLRRARAAYEAAQRLAPGDERIRRQRALALLASPTEPAEFDELLAGAPAREEAAVRLRALAALRRDDPTAAAHALASVRNPSPLGLLAFGLAKLQAGDREGVVEALEKARRSRKPLSGETRQALGIVTVAAQTGRGDLSGALKTLRALDVPREATLRQALAAVARELGLELLLDERMQQATDAWRRALAAEPEHRALRGALTHLHEVLGTQASRRGDYLGAAEQWEAALAYAADETRIVRNLALAEERLERWGKASQRWEQLTEIWKRELRGKRGDHPAATELRHRLLVAYQHLATTYEAADDFQAAARTLERALSFDQTLVDLRLRAGELYLEAGQDGKAIEHLRRVLAARPGDTRVLVNLGSAYDARGDDRQAQDYLEQALALEPDNKAVKATLASVYHGRGHRLADSGQAQRAVTEYERAIELDPGFSEHFECLGAVYLQLSRADSAKVSFERALALGGDRPQTRVLIGGIYVRYGFETEAEKHFRQALRAGRDPMVSVTIGIVYLRSGRVEKALQYFGQTLKGREPLFPALVGKLLIEYKREAEAIPYLERALRLDVWNLRARLDLAWAYTFGRADFARARGELDQAEQMATIRGDQQILAEIREARVTVDELEMGSRAGRRSPFPEGAWR